MHEVLYIGVSFMIHLHTCVYSLKDPLNTQLFYLQFGQSAMMVASWEGHLGIVEALISAEADTNLQDGVIDILYSYNLY